MFSLKRTLKNTKIIAAFTLLSRILGYIRDVVIAYHFGASVYTDMFFIAFRIPNSLRRFLGEGAINSSVVPVLSKADEREKPLVVYNIILWFGFFLFGVAVMGVLLSKVLLVAFAAGYLHSPFYETMNSLIKITFPYLFFIGLVVLLMGILNSYNHFAIPAFAPSLLNISLIASVLFLTERLKQPVYALAFGVLLGGVLQLAVSVFDFFRLKIPPKIHFGVLPSTKEIFSLMGLTAIGSSAAQISSMVDAFVASFLASGSFTFLFYANRLFQLPFAVFSIALTQSSLPDLAKLKREQLARAVSFLLRFVLFISIAVEMYFIFFADDIVKLLFMHGRFSAFDAKNTALALKIMIAGFVFFSFSKILSNAFYSLKDAKTPLKASVISSGVAIATSLILGFRLGFVGLAISTAITGVVNCIALWFYAKREIGDMRLANIYDRFLLIELVLLFAVSALLFNIKFGFVAAGVFYMLFVLYGFKIYSKREMA